MSRPKSAHIALAICRLVARENRLSVTEQRCERALHRLMEQLFENEPGYDSGVVFHGSGWTIAISRLPDASEPTAHVVVAHPDAKFWLTAPSELHAYWATPYEVGFPQKRRRRKGKP